MKAPESMTQDEAIEEIEILRDQKAELVKLLQEQVDAYDKQIAEYKGNEDWEIVKIAEMVHGKRMSRSRDYLAKLK